MMDTCDQKLQNFRPRVKKSCRLDEGKYFIREERSYLLLQLKRNRCTELHQKSNLSWMIVMDEFDIILGSGQSE